MTASTRRQTIVLHPGEAASNQLRTRLSQAEPHALRTFTPSLAVIQQSSGWTHYTPEGRALADFTSGVLVANLGYNPTRWWRHVTEYMGVSKIPASGEFFKAAPLNAYNAVTELEVQASERLLAFMRAQPGGERCELVCWAASGSEAIQKALWASLAKNPARDQILATRYGFHGKKGLANAVTGTENDKDRDPRVHFISFPQEECSTLQKSRERLDVTRFRQELAGLYKKHGPRLGTLITEPYLGGGGSYHPQPEYLQLLQAFCREHELTFILDEVQSNFGRTGEIFAYTKYGLEPDIVVLGKGLGNGVAVSAAVGRADLFGALHYGEASDTWSGNPLSCAAVLATLDEFEAHDVMGNVRSLGQAIETGLLRLTGLPVVKAVRGEAGVWGLECAAVGRHAAETVAERAVQACYLGKPDGTAIHLLGPLAGKVIRVSPPLVMPADVASSLLAAMYDILAELSETLARDG